MANRSSSPDDGPGEVLVDRTTVESGRENKSPWNRLGDCRRRIQPGARQMESDWVKDIRNQCVKAEVAFFFKQWGGVRKKKSGRELEGRTWDEMPELLTL